MSYQPYYITQYEQETGLENYFQSFLLPEKAFPVIEDAYCWRGRRTENKINSSWEVMEKSPVSALAR